MEQIKGGYGGQHYGCDTCYEQPMYGYAYPSYVGGANYGGGFALIVVLFILLIIIGASYCK
nr:YjcZ family sporulation protein [Bacillus yapensis]